MLGAQDKEGGDVGRDKGHTCVCIHQPLLGTLGINSGSGTRCLCRAACGVRRVDGLSYGWRCVSDRQIEKGEGGAALSGQGQTTIHLSCTQQSVWTGQTAGQQHCVGLDW